jgi:hypothetical protein
MKKIGVWLDKEKAYIISLHKEDESMIKIDSNIENYRIHGGSGTRFKGGPQDVVQDSRYLEREKHQTKRYFKEIIEHLKSADAIIILGPADIDKNLKKELNLFHKNIDEKVVLVKKVDSMTDNQLIALVKELFKTN